MTGLAAAIDDVLDTVDTTLEPVERLKPYVTALPAGQLFVDPSYQRPLDDMRVSKMVEDYDDRPTIIRRAERLEAVRRMRAGGESLNTMATKTGKAQRQVARDLADLGLTEQVPTT